MGISRSNGPMVTVAKARVMLSVRTVIVLFCLSVCPSVCLSVCLYAGLLQSNQPISLKLVLMIKPVAIGRIY